MTLNKNNWGGQHSYESPSVKELELQSEGVLCESGEVTINLWENDEESLDFN